MRSPPKTCLVSSPRQSMMWPSPRSTQRGRERRCWGMLSRVSFLYFNWFLFKFPGTEVWWCVLPSAQLNTFCVWSEVVPAPKNLQFSEVTQTSFRTSWEHGAPDVALYRLSWSKRGENDYQYVSGRESGGGGWDEARILRRVDKVDHDP